METLAQNLAQRAKKIIGTVINNSPNSISDIIDLNDDSVTAVHIHAGIVAYKHDITKSVNDTVFSLGYKAKGYLYPVVFVAAKDGQISVAKDNWQFAKSFIEAAEQKLGITPVLAAADKPRVAMA